MSYDVLLEEIRTIHGYQSVKDVSSEHPPRRYGRPVAFIEVLAASDAFCTVNDKKPDDVAKIAYDGPPLRTLIPVRLSDLDGSVSAAQLADVIGTSVLMAANRVFAGSWG